MEVMRMATPAQSQTPGIEDLLKKLREDLDKSLKEAENATKSAQQSLQSMTKLSEELKKLAEELRKPPTATAATTTRPTR
jgi:peptidoglycan hydrolase CwlO-like protein